MSQVEANYTRTSCPSAGEEQARMAAAVVTADGAVASTPSRSTTSPRRTSSASMKSDFRPPRDSPWIIRLMQRLNPLIARLWCRVVAIDVPQEDLQRLRVLQQSRYLLCANHPTLCDPL